MANVLELRAFRDFCRTALKEPRFVAKDTRPWEKAEIAERFNYLRNKVHLTQRELGVLIGVDRKTICRAETLRVMPHPSTWKYFEELEAKHSQPRIELPTDWLKELRAELDCQSSLRVEAHAKSAFPSRSALSAA